MQQCPWLDRGVEESIEETEDSEDKDGGEAENGENDPRVEGGRRDASGGG